MKFNVSSRFKRAYKKLPKQIRDDFDKKITVFAKEPYHPSLRTHKLKGKFQECRAFYLQDGYRVLFDFSGSDNVDLLDIGSHGIYKRRPSL